jgi:hypothetical protein
MKHIPDYLMPKKKGADVSLGGSGGGSEYIPFKTTTDGRRRGGSTFRGGRGGRGGGRGGGNRNANAASRKKNDPLKTFKI